MFWILFGTLKIKKLVPMILDTIYWLINEKLPQQRLCDFNQVCETWSIYITFESCFWIKNRIIKGFVANKLDILEWSKEDQFQVMTNRTSHKLKFAGTWMPLRQPRILIKTYSVWGDSYIDNKQLQDKTISINKLEIRIMYYQLTSHPVHPGIPICRWRAIRAASIRF